MSKLKKLYLEIWSEREHVSELTGKHLLPPDHFQFHWQFLHILPKSGFPSMKFEKRNILLARPDEHENQEQYEIFNQRKEELMLEHYSQNEVKKL